MYKSVFSLQAFLLGLLLFSTTTAQVPRVFSVQGVLSGTQFKSEHAHIITTTLYAVDSEDKSLYSQSDTLFIERNGLFTIQIGKDKGLPTSLSFDKQYVVEFTVNGSVMPMRIPLQSVPYAITSEKVSDNSVELRHLSEGLKQQLQIQENSKSDKGENTLANYVGGFRSVISGGDENRTSANFSSILGGYTNNVSGTYGTVAGGQSNRVSGNWSFVGGGQNNRAFGSWSSVTAGRDNMVSSSATYATISGGLTNQVGAVNGTISGGSSNIVTSQGGTVSGGQSNRAMQTFATVSGGQNNIASGQGSVTAGGMNNKATSQYSIVSGGSNNEANGNHAVVSGGMNNDANAEFSSIAGGNENVIASNARASFISGGSNNKINSGMNTGIMGSNNTITSSNNSFVMGTGNTISNASNGIGIGTGNQVSGQNATAIGIGNITNANNEFVIGSYASTSSNPANSSNPSFTGSKRFSVGIGSSASQRKNAITVFENGNTLFHGKVLTTETAFLNSAEIINDVSIGGNLDVVGDATVNGTLNATGQFNASNLSGTNTGDITIGTANGLSLSGQTLSLSTATTTTAGAMSASDKTKLDGIVTGAEVNVNADWNAISGDAEILNKPTLGTMSAETANDYYTKSQTDAGFQVKDADLSTVATIGTSDQLLKVKNDGSGLEWFTPNYISSYTETDPKVGTIATSGVPRWNGTALVTGSLSDDGTNLTTSGTITSSNLSGTNTGNVSIGTANGLSINGQTLSLATATTTTAGAMSANDKLKLESISNNLIPGAHGQMLYSCNGSLQWGPCLPLVSTAAVTGVSDVQANTGGSVDNEGGVSVTAKGVVWNTSPNPTVSLSTKTIDGSGIGSFTSNLTGLTRLTTYYVRAYATNSTGTAYGTEYSFTTLNTPQIGDSYQGGVIAYIYQLGDEGYIAGETHGLIAAESDFSTKYIYGCAGINIVGAGSVTNGQQNTIDIVSGCSTPSIAAKVCNDLVLNGYTDWYLPSRDELTILYQNRNSIGGFALGFSPDFYWSSTECDNTPGNACDPPTSWAFARRFSDGNNGVYTKGSSLRVRAVRKF